MLIYKEIVDELNFILEKKGDILVKAYYKVVNGIKVYYDFQYRNTDEQLKLKGSYDLLCVQELLCYIKEDTAT